MWLDYCYISTRKRHWDVGFSFLTLTNHTVRSIRSIRRKDGSSVPRFSCLETCYVGILVSWPLGSNIGLLPPGHRQSPCFGWPKAPWDPRETREIYGCRDQKIDAKWSDMNVSASLDVAGISGLPSGTASLHFTPMALVYTRGVWNMFSGPSPSQRRRQATFWQLQDGHSNPFQHCSKMSLPEPTLFTPSGK